ncbi:MAG TPA: hypothetical protein VGI12_12200 [Vicinamibacterales bacterium]|jgi:hypothetical protein
MAHRTVRGMITLLACCSIAAMASAQTANPWYGRMAKPKDFDPPKTFANTFSIELPKDWQLVPGHTGTVFLAAEKTKRYDSGAAIALEYMSLQGAFDASIIDALAPLELKDVQARELSGSSFTQQVVKQEGRPIIIIQYDRPSLSGAKDHVVQYSIPAGTTMYHLICIAPGDELPKWRPVFAHVAATFTPAKAGS